MRISKKATEKLRQMDVDKLTLGQRIRLIRGDRTQTEFGALLGKSQDAISVYETDQVIPSLQILAKIAEIGDVTVDWLFYGPSHKAKKDGEQSFVFNGRIIRQKSPEWQLLEKIVNIHDEKVKEKIVELVNSYINIEKKGKA
jgi:transcriptional regulator with XRE-family HTH domain